jgi:hypothetical protein
LTPELFFQAIRIQAFAISRQRGGGIATRVTMKTPVLIVTAALTAAILLAASLLIVTGTRGEGAQRPLTDHPAGRVVLTSPAGKQSSFHSAEP